MTKDQKTPLVLIVDDDVTAFLILSSILRQAGFRVDCATTVEEGWTNANRNHPDLILMDMHLPDGNGIDLCRRLKTQSVVTQIPIIFISADNSMATKLGGFDAGGADYVAKPFATAEVLARVRTHLRMKYAYDSLARMQAERIERLANAQKTILPRAENMPTARFAVSMVPFHETGGDFYDVIPISEQITDYIVADASGHDLDAAFWTAALKALLHEYATPLNTPVDAMQNINNSLCHILPTGAFFTMIYARLNRRGGNTILVNAGHPPAITITSHPTHTTIVEQAGDVVGAFRDASFGITSLTLQPTDRLLLYSDGLVELTGPRITGIQALAATSTSQAHSPLEAMVESTVKTIRADATIEDDMVLMGVEV